MYPRSILLVLISIILIGGLGLSLSETGDALSSRAPINEGTILLEADQSDQTTGTGYPIKTAIPGQELRYTLWIRNNHDEAQTIIMEILTPEGWDVYVTGSINLDPDSTGSINLDVTVPDEMMMDPQSDYQIRIDGVANLTGDRAFIIAVARLEAEVDHDLVIYPDDVAEKEVKVYPGQKTYLELLLRNQGEIIDDITLEIGEHQSSWDARFQDETVEQKITLPAGASGGTVFITRLLIGVPETSEVGDSQTISVRSTSGMFELYGVGKSDDRIDILFRVVNPSTLSIFPETTMTESESGEQLHLKYNVIHNGVLPSSFDPKVKVLSGSFQQSNWQFTIDIGGPSIFEVGETREVTVHILPPKGTSGDFDIFLGGNSDNAKVLEGSMTVVVNSGSNITYTDLEISEAKMGSDVVIRFRVLNNGDSTSQVLLDLEDLPSCFISDIDPQSMSLGPETSRGITVILYPRTKEVPLQFSFMINLKVPVEEKEWILATGIEVPVTMMELPNVVVNSIVLPNRPIDEGEVVQINVTVDNPSNLDMEGLTLEIYEITYSFSNFRISSVPISMASGEEMTVRFNWTARPSAQKIRAILVPSEGSEETDSLDNDLTEPINVIPRRTGSGDQDSDGGDGTLATETAVAAVVGGSVLLTSIILFVNTEYVRYPLFSSLFPLYSKLKPEHLLSNRLRKRIYVYVQNNPGEHFRAILVNLNLTNGTLAHHLYTLEKENLIRSQRDGLYRRFYPAGYHIEENRISLSPMQRRIMELIVDEPGLSQKDISQKLSVSNSTVNYNIKALKEKEQIVVEKKGKSTFIYPEPDRNS
jgi:uncharacterized membrane protein/DNA-binding CsgD family transcriptional regulator